MHRRSGSPVPQQVSPRISIDDTMFKESDDDTALRVSADSFQRLPFEAQQQQQQQHTEGSRAIYPDDHPILDSASPGQDLLSNGGGGGGGGGSAQGAIIKRGRPSYWQQLCAIWMYGWVAEVLGCLLAILSLGAIILILGLYQDLPLPEWPMGITLNAFIAIFSMFIKAGISIPLSEGLGHLKWQWFLEGPHKLIDLEEFDAAGRGPWGAFLFLLRFEHRPGKYFGLRRIMRRLFAWTRSDLLNTFAKLSALLIVLAFAIDPFTQQVLQYSPCLRKDGSAQATLARTNMYWAPGNSTSAASQEFSEDFNIAWAIYMGLVERPEVASFQCPTGNCTFPEFSTVGVCHACYDISGSVQDRTDRLSEADKTPNGPYAPQVWYIIPEDVQAGHPSLELANSTLLRSDVVFRDKHNPSLLSSVRFISVPYDGETQVYGTPNAAICDLDPCARTFRSRVVQSKLEEVEIGRVEFGDYRARENQAGLYRDDDWPNYYVALGAERGSAILPSPLPAAATKAKAKDGQSITTCEGSASNQTASGMIAVATEKEGEILWYPPACVYSLSTYASIAAPAEIWRQVSGLWHGPSYEESYVDQKNLATASRVIYGDSGSVDLDRINFIMGNVVDSMTASMRSRGGTTLDSEGEYIDGIAYTVVTCANVDWKWLSPSAVLVVLATFWLGILIWQSSRGEATKRGWKSGTLPLLFSSLGEKESRSGCSSGDEEEYAEDDTKALFDTTRFGMEEMATSIDVRLVRDEDGKPKFIRGEVDY